MDKDALNSSSSPSKVYAFWKDFDLEREKLDISEKRKKLKENRENSIKKQKIWGVGSADQEAASDEASVEATSAETSLLLDYKAEIDRANEAEKAFIELSDKICRAIDPFPLFSICRDENKRINWDFKVKVPKVFQVPYDASKEKEPRFLSDYIVQSELGEGGFGVVFECQKRIDRHMYAVKKILIKNDEKRESILREVYALSRLEHRNIIRYYDIDRYTYYQHLNTNEGQGICPWKLRAPTYTIESEKVKIQDKAWIEPYGDELSIEDSRKDSKHESSSSTATTKSSVDPDSNALYIQMQLCCGSLYDKILSTEITQVEASKYMRQITEGLHYLHLNEVVHGDLSSTNVLLDDSGNAIIGDFGLVVIPNLPHWDKEGSDQEDGNQEESDQEDGNQEESAQEGGNQVVEEGGNQGSGQVGGNLLYLAPERRKSKGSPLAPPSPKWDIYSLGLIFVELVAGFSSESPEFDRVRRIHNAKDNAKSGKLSDEIPKSDHPLLLKMLSYDPQARLSTTEVLEQLKVRRA